MSDENETKDTSETADKPAAAAPPVGADAPAGAAGPLGEEDDVVDPLGDGDEEDDARAKLEEQLEAAKKEAAATKERMLRVAADFENFRRRSVRELDETRQRAKMDAVKEVLPVFDNLERGMDHADSTGDPSSVVDGVRMTLKQFIDTLDKLGIQRIDAIGKPFDPNLHESIQFEHSDEHEAGIVIKEFHAGYRQGEKLLRPTLCVVSRGPASTEAPSGDAKPEAEPEEKAADDPATASAGEADEAEPSPDGDKKETAEGEAE